MEMEVCEEIMEVLKDYHIGELSFNNEAHLLQERMVMEGIKYIKVFPVCDGFILLQSIVKGEVDKVSWSHKEWWKIMFKEVKVWSPNLVARSSKVWIKVWGVPLHVWNEKFFKRIGSKFGTFVEFDEDTIEIIFFDVARILVSTKRMSLVEEHLRISIMGVVYTIWVVEEGAPREVVVDYDEFRKEEKESLFSRF